MSANRSNSPAERCYSALLWLYPRRFRDEYRADMELLFCEQCRDEPVWRVSTRAVLDLAVTIPTQHLEARMNSNPNPLIAILFAALATGGLLLAILGGSEPASLIIGLGLTLVTGTLSVVAWRRAAPVPTERASRTWWILVIGGLALIGLVIAASGAGVEAWYLGLASILTAFLLIAAGLVVGGAHAVKYLRRSSHTA